MSSYLTAPETTTKMPKAMPYIMVNETAERYAFYSLMAILATFLQKHIVTFQGEPANLSEARVTELVGWFQTACYFTPVLGSLISDIFWGKYKTIILFSLVYCVGFAAITFDQSYLGALIGLSLIATGTGIIKPCVSANVGDQFGHANQHLISPAYNLFYWAVNIGATLSMFIAPVILANGNQWSTDLAAKLSLAIDPNILARGGVILAFGSSGVFMILATIAYWLGRRRFAHIPPKGFGFVKETLSAEGLLVIAKLFFFIYIFVAIFWSLFNQTMSKWVLQAKKMDLTFFNWSFPAHSFPGNLLAPLRLDTVQWNILPEQLQAVNSLLVVMAIPIFTYLIYPLINRFFRLTAPRKIAIGFFIAVPSFIIPALLEGWIDQGQTPSCWWQVLAYTFITAGEVMISIPALEFSYTQAPKQMKSFISSLNLISVALGSFFIAILNNFIQNADGTLKLQGPDYYWFFAWLLLGTAILFTILIRFYREKTYIQDEATA